MSRYNGLIDPTRPSVIWHIENYTYKSNPDYKKESFKDYINISNDKEK